MSGIRKLKNNIWSVIRLFFGYGERLRKTENFKKNLLNLTTKVNTLDELKSMSLYDIYVVGSDQVWLPNTVTISNGIYFLNFAPESSKKISYASSFGTVNIPKKLDKTYYKNLSGFTKISVREKQGEDYLKTIGLESTVVLDPTLLLSHDEWKNYFDIKPKVNKPYVLCYVMPGDHKGANFIRDLSAKLDKFEKCRYKIIVIGDKEYKKLYPHYNLITNAGPEDFLNYFYNASYIVTNSFHGTCFSLIFKKMFISVLHKDNHLNSRITNLLDSTKLSERIIYTDTNLNAIDFSKINTETDYRSLDDLKEKSIAFLNEALDR